MIVVVRVSLIVEVDHVACLIEPKLVVITHVHVLDEHVHLKKDVPEHLQIDLLFAPGNRWVLKHAVPNGIFDQAEGIDLFHVPTHAIFHS